MAGRTSPLSLITKYPLPPPRAKIILGFLKMSDSTDIAVRDVHDIIGYVAHFYEKGKSGNKKEVQMEEEKTKEVRTEQRRDNALH